MGVFVHHPDHMQVNINAGIDINLAKWLRKIVISGGITESNR